MSDTTGQPSEETVAAYLREHPDFFVRHKTLLESLRISVEDKVVSLQEYRLKQLQEVRADLATRLSDLTLNAIDNERRLQYLHELATDLLSRQSIEQALNKIDETLENRFQVPLRRLLLALPESPDVPFAEQVSMEQLQETSGREQDAQKADAELLQKCFPGARPGAGGSLILAPIAGHPGLLMLGSYDEGQFRADKGLLFLDLLTDLISALLTRQYGPRDV